jgi:hypothetical protein
MESGRYRRYKFIIAQIGIYLGMFVRNGLVKRSEALQSLFEFAVVIAENYFANPYHSFNHAIDVTYVVYYLIEDMRLGEQLDLTRSDQAVLLLSALGHDVLHPGTNNLFQVFYASQIRLIQNQPLHSNTITFLY